MKKIILLAGVLVGLAAMFLTFGVSAQNPQPNKSMKMNAGIITPKLQESKIFYSKVLNFGVSFENEFYLLMHTPNQQAQISFLLPDHPTQRPIFQLVFGGKGIFLTIEVE